MPEHSRTTFLTGSLVTPDMDICSSTLSAAWRDHSSNQSLTFCLSNDPCLKLHNCFPVKSLE